MDSTMVTDRLILKPISLDDVSELYELMKEKELTIFLAWDPHQEIATTEAVVRSLIESQLSDKAYHWCVFSGNIVVGLVSLIDVKRKIRAWTLNRAELSYWIGKQHQGKGYATEASKAVLEFGFEILGLHKVIVAHAFENIESKKICNKLGFIQYAHERDAFCKNGKWHDLIWYEIVKGDNYENR